MNYEFENVYGLKVFYTKETHGGGIPIFPDFINVIKTLYPNKKFNNCLEWCAGPGFIGFAVLANNISSQITLLESYQPALDLAQLTIKENNLDNIVTLCLSDNFKSVTNDSKFDLIVGNPPHYCTDVYAKHIKYWESTSKRIYYDKEWSTHFDFFRTVYSKLTDDGKILLVENIRGSSEETFLDILKENNLRITNHFFSPSMPTNYWYLEISKDS